MLEILVMCILFLLFIINSVGLENGWLVFWGDFGLEIYMFNFFICFIVKLYVIGKLMFNLGRWFLSCVLLLLDIVIRFMLVLVR